MSSKKKKNRRRPLDYKDAEPKANLTAEQLAYERAELDGLRNGGDVARIDFACSAMLTLDPADEPKFGDPLPTCNVLKLRKFMKRFAGAELASGGWTPSADVLWDSARNDFSGETMRQLLDWGGLRNINNLHLTRCK